MGEDGRKSKNVKNRGSQERKNYKFCEYKDCRKQKKDGKEGAERDGRMVEHCQVQGE